MSPGSAVATAGRVLPGDAAETCACMFTVCPKCALTLVVTAADLRVAQGYVRCGRCSSVFNALARLTEERQGGAAGEPSAAAEAEPPPASAETAAPSPGAPPEELIPETALEFDPATTDVNSVFVQPPPDPQWTAATGSFKAMVAANQEAAEPELPDSQVDVEIDAAFLASMLRAESVAPESAPAPAPTAAAVAQAPLPAEHAPEAHDAQPVRAADAAAGTRSSPGPAKAAVGAATAPPPARARAPLFDKSDPEGLGLEVKEEQFARAAKAAAHVPRAEQAERAGDAAAASHGHAWSVGAALAALLLLAQIVNHHRDELAANPRFNRPLTTLYTLLGVKLFPHWDLRAYDVRQLGASAGHSGAGVITVRASIKNAAPQPQPLPLLRVTLQDRFGNRIAARDVQPRAYLPGVIPPSSFLSAGQRIDAEMGFADPGADAVGFEIDACLPARGGGIACANDVTLR
jgi:predicted Zn finger-like uncharacterized protein